MRTLDLGEAVGPGVPTGGTANQVLVKNGATNFDTSWKDASQLPAISDEATAREAADAALADGLAIIANGDTHAAVAAGQAVFVRSHSTLAAGLYWASSAIGTNAALSTSNLTADNQGGLNKLKGDIDSLNSKITGRKPTTFIRPLSENQTSEWTYTAPHDGTLYLVIVGTVRSYCSVMWNNNYIAAIAFPDNSVPLAHTVPVNVKKNDAIKVMGLNTNCYLIATQTAFIANGVDV